MVTLALTGGVLGSWPAAAQEGPKDRRAAIQDLLDRRAKAFLERDEAGFMATVSRSHPAFFQRQLRAFRWADGVPFTSYRLVANWDLLGDLARPSDAARHPGAADIALPVTQERYTLGRYDEQPAVEDLFLTLVREGDRWLVGSDSDLEDVGLRSSRHLWDRGPIREQRSEHFSLLSHPCGSPAGCPALPEGLLSLAEGALERVDEHWSGPWRRRVVLLVPSTQEELAEIIQATFELDDFVAFATSTVDIEQDLAYGGHRILLNPTALDGRPDESLSIILAHELLHVATRTVSGPFVPTFVEEGIAEYVGRDADPAGLTYLDSRIATGDFDAALPQNWEFITGSSDDIYTSYQEAQSAVHFFVQRWGKRDLVSFYRSLGRRRVTAGTSAYHLDRALRAATGVGAQRFEELWADSIAG